MKLSGMTTGRRGDARIAKDRSTDWSRVMTERIDHAAESRKHIGWVHDWQTREGDTPETGTSNALIAQVHATLALVEQQRVGNMIALMASAARGVANQTHSVQDYMEMFNRINPQVIKALGLNEGSET